MFFSHLVKLNWTAQKFKLRSITRVYSFALYVKSYILLPFSSNCLRNWTFSTQMCHISKKLTSFHYRGAEEAWKTTYLSLMYTHKPEHKHIQAISLTPTVLLKQWLWTIVCKKCWRSKGKPKAKKYLKCLFFFPTRQMFKAKSLSHNNA